MSELINKLILKKLAGRCEFFQFDYANYFANCFLSMFITPNQNHPKPTHPKTHKAGRG